MSGKIVVVTRSEPGGEAWMNYLRQQGAAPYHLPTIRTVPVALTPELAATLRGIPNFDWLVFTSAAAPRFLKTLAAEAGIHFAFGDMPPVAAIGDETARVAREAGYEIAFQPSVSSSEALAKEFPPLQGRSVMLLRSAIAPKDLPLALARFGADVSDVTLYDAGPIREPDPVFSELLRDGKIGHVLFASPSAVRGFCLRAPEDLMSIAKRISAIAAGASVVAALREAGFEDIVMAEGATIENMVAAMFPRYNDERNGREPLS